MKTYEYSGLEQIKPVLQRPSIDNTRIENIVKPILEKVKRGGDRALKKMALEYDHVELDDLWVSKKELKAAANRVDDDLKKAIEVAHRNIKRFHEAQVQSPQSMEIMPGVSCSRKSVPIQKVGLYIPGGTAPLFSTVLMLGVPANIAGCEEIILASPSNKVGEINPVVLYTADLLGIQRILKLGGAHAIGALAYGSDTVPAVDKIFGPGNQYVTVAKQLVAKDSVSIDMPAGPSEVMVVIDKNAKASFAASDLLSQAEHGVDSQVVLVSTSASKAEKVQLRLHEQLELLPRKDIAEKALQNSAVIIASTEKDVLQIINEYAPEHLILNMDGADKIADKVVNAGSVFVGAYTPESAGDYASGTNHTLPTNGWARSYSGVSLDSFVKNITYQTITEEGIRNLGPSIEKMAAAELLDAHKNAVSIRLKHLNK